MRIVVFGATGKTGLDVLKHGLAKGHEMTDHVRETCEPATSELRASSYHGDVDAAASIARALEQARFC